MKMKRFFSMLIALACIVAFAVPTFARASEQIRTYSVDVTALSGTIAIDFYISGTATMDEIGCESIDVYEKSGSRWILSESWDENDSGMAKSNAKTFANVIECDSEEDIEYKVVVAVFADDGSERDTRTRTFYVTGK